MAQLYSIYDFLLAFNSNIWPNLPLSEIGSANKESLDLDDLLFFFFF